MVHLKVQITLLNYGFLLVKAKYPKILDQEG